MRLHEVFTVGLEARLVPEQVRPVDGSPTTIPAHWSLISVFAGVDEQGNVSLYSALTGVDTRGNDFVSAKWAVDRVLQHYPVDGCDIRVDNDRVISRVDYRNANRLRRWRMWVPPNDVLVDGDQVVEGRITGMGIGLEFRGGLGYLSPYYAVLVYEEQPNPDKSRNAPEMVEVPLVVPARLFAPFDPKTRPGEDDEGVRKTIPALFARMRERGDIGDTVSCRVTATPVPHYYCEDVYSDTALGHAFQEAGVKRADPTAGPGETKA